MSEQIPQFTAEEIAEIEAAIASIDFEAMKKIAEQYENVKNG